MDLKVVGSTQELQSGAILVVPLFVEDTADTIRQLLGESGSRAQSVLQNGHARSSLYDSTLLYPDDGQTGVLLVGCGKRDEFSTLRLKRAAAAASRALTGRSYTSFSILERDVLRPFDFGHGAVEGAIYGAYSPGVKQTKAEGKPTLEAVTLVATRDLSQVQSGAQVGQMVGEARTVARDLVNLPPNDLTPRSFAERAQQLAQEHGLEYTCFDEDQMRQLGMGSLLGVAAGSAQPPRLFTMRYSHGVPKVKLALVGKGLTFDSGGLSLKPTDAMTWMKGDMGGGAAVVGGMVAVARLAPQNIEVTGYVGATENMTGPAAMKVGDVLTAMNGETIEVLNTDAEGRLVLADVLTYAVQQGATHIVDFATLTGAAVISLGHAATLAVGKPETWVNRVVHASNQGLDRAWPMPLYPEYREAMQSTVADIKNVGGRAGGALTAAAFLSDFVQDVPWTHMDIAGTAFAESSNAYEAEGGTGVGVGTIASLVYELSSE